MWPVKYRCEYSIKMLEEQLKLVIQHREHLEHFIELYTESLQKQHNEQMKQQLQKLKKDRTKLLKEQKIIKKQIEKFKKELKDENQV